jgi:hypothetical protein
MKIVPGDRQRARIVLLGGRYGQPRDWPRGWLHDRHGVEVARELRYQSNGRP